MGRCAPNLNLGGQNMAKKKVVKKAAKKVVKKAKKAKC